MWTKPDEFHPEHFLAGGRLVEDRPGFLPYGVGKRICPGAKLADMQVSTTVPTLHRDTLISVRWSPLRYVCAARCNSSNVLVNQQPRLFFR